MVINTIKNTYQYYGNLYFRKVFYWLLNLSLLLGESQLKSKVIFCWKANIFNWFYEIKKDRQTFKKSQSNPIEYANRRTILDNIIWEWKKTSIGVIPILSEANEIIDLKMN